MKAKSGSSKAQPTTIKQRHEETTQSCTLNKYSGMSVSELRELIKPFGITGSGKMRTDELLQLCLLFDTELTGEFLDTFINTCLR